MSLSNRDQKDAAASTGDLIVFGDTDAWKLICKASSESEKFMKSTKALEVPGVGVVVQVTTQKGAVLGNAVAEALTFVPGARIEETVDADGAVISRKIVAA